MSPLFGRWSDDTTAVFRSGHDMFFPSSFQHSVNRQFGFGLVVNDGSHWSIKELITNRQTETSISSSLRLICRQPPPSRER